MKNFLVVIVLLLHFIPKGYGQVNFVFLPEVYGRSVDGLGSFQVQNLGASRVSGRIAITVKESSSGQLVVKAVTPLADFTPGVSTLSKSIYNKTGFSFSSNGFGKIASQTRNFPPGVYNFCFTFLPADKGMTEDDESCFEGEIQPLVPITLITPSHQDTICDKRPVLGWQPPIPFTAGMRFRLLLTEKTKRSAIESLLTNRPLLLLDNISSVSLLYPAAYPELQEGKTYCWQVVAYEKGVIISKSEIWEFTVQCKEEPPTVPSDSYRDLKFMQNGNYYIANYYFKCAFRNNYNVSELRYEVLDVSKGMEKVKRLPAVKINTGINQLAIDLSDSELVPGQEYILKVYPFNEPAVQVRFTYQENDEKSN